LINNWATMAEFGGPKKANFTDKLIPIPLFVLLCAFAMHLPLTSAVVAFSQHGTNVDLCVAPQQLVLQSGFNGTIVAAIRSWQLKVRNSNAR